MNSKIKYIIIAAVAVIVVAGAFCWYRKKGTASPLW